MWLNMLGYGKDGGRVCAEICGYVRTCDSEMMRSSMCTGGCEGKRWGRGSGHRGFNSHLVGGRLLLYFLEGL